MFYKLDNIHVEVNFFATLRDLRGRVIDRRERHNVFTDVGRDWLAHLVAWEALGDPDTPKTNARVRWMALGTGLTQLEQASVIQLEVPTRVDDAGNYLVALQSSEFIAPASPSDRPTMRFKKEFSGLEVTTETNPVVALSEAGLFVDVFKADAPPVGIGGADDVPASGLNTILDPTFATNRPVAYARFEPLTKTQDFIFEILWDFRF
jgi:hypothetical protein